MDIILRIPEDQLRHFADDKTSTDLAFWRFPKRPLRLNNGDHIFFTRPEGIVFAAAVDRIVEGEELTDEINVFHMFGDAGNFNACWNGRKTRAFDPPITDINYAGRGYRYLTEQEEQKLKALIN